MAKEENRLQHCKGSSVNKLIIISAVLNCNMDDLDTFLHFNLAFHSLHYFSVFINASQKATEFTLSKYYRVHFIAPAGVTKSIQ